MLIDSYELIGTVTKKAQEINKHELNKSAGSRLIYDRFLRSNFSNSSSLTDNFNVNFFDVSSQINLKVDGMALRLLRTIFFRSSGPNEIYKMYYNK